MNPRKSVFAGSWYPGGADECEREIRNFLKQGADKPKGKYVGGIVPHAGWYFSGRIACQVIHSLAHEDPPDVIVIFGMHLGPGSPCYIMSEGVWETPLGNLEIEERLAGELVSRFQFNIETAERYARDNTIELQLPFIKYFFRDVRIVPMGVPPVASSFEIGRAAADISKRLNLKMKVIGSTDLTHYGINYGFTPKGTGSEALNWMRDENDRRVIDAMLSLDPGRVIHEALENHNACCSGAAGSAIAAARALGAQEAEMIAYATSHDKHPGDSFVGYVGILF